ncbi:hypothetical protein AAFF_G00306150 [Aldrovandia affinis]|uniref:Uncharacterized protein n=1 Tax=Aldrovandia affinis TaxID=143900 RepID=A0AAD7SPJ0_9TELE|nr:hypothetical protein AAFF_G00306150 [Aldrovandia affinis]
MENYFQAEAFNLDKVLDEFEQNEDETDIPTLSDAKWTQILAPPAHLLSLNPALTFPDLSPREPPLNFKPFPESPDRANGSERPAPRDRGPAPGPPRPALSPARHRQAGEQQWRDAAEEGLREPPVPGPGERLPPRARPQRARRGGPLRGSSRQPKRDP